MDAIDNGDHGASIFTHSSVTRDGHTPGVYNPAAAISGSDPGNPYRPADILHAEGNDKAATATYLQHHPGVMKGTATNIPGYVTKTATAAVSKITKGMPSRTTLPKFGAPGRPATSTPMPESPK